MEPHTDAIVPGVVSIFNTNDIIAMLLGSWAGGSHVHQGGAQCRVRKGTPVHWCGGQRGGEDEPLMKIKEGTDTLWLFGVGYSNPPALSVVTAAAR